MSSVTKIAEQVVLGALLDNSGDDDGETYLQQAVSGLAPAAFTPGPHQRIFAAICDLYLEGIPVGLGSLHEHLGTKGALAEVGGYPALTDLLETVLTEPAGAPATYLAQLQDQFRARRAANDLQLIAEQLGSDLTLDAAAERVEALFSSPSQSSLSLPDIGEQIQGLHTRFHEDRLHPRGFVGIPTGWTDLDGSGNGGSSGGRQLIGGLRPGFLTYIGARPAVGKTVVLIDWARAAVQAKHGCYFASTEMTANEILARLTVSLTATVKLRDFLHHPETLTPSQIEQVENAMAEIADMPLVIDDQSTDVPAIARGAAAARAKFRSAGRDLEAIYQDYQQLLQDPPGQPTQSEYARVSANSTRLKLLAKKMLVPVTAAVQLGRDAAAPDRPASLTDLKSSGQLEQDADLVILLNRPFATDPDAAEKGILPSDMTAHVAKFRHGAASQTVQRDFIGEFMKTIDPDRSRWSQTERAQASPLSAASSNWGN